jgi:hypothetical protein
MTSRLALGIAIVALCSACYESTEPLDELIPASWDRVSETGRIASICFGGGSECGQVERVYEVDDADAAVTALRASVDAAGWALTDDATPPRDTSYAGSATDPAGETTAIFTIKGNTVYVAYQQR